MDGSKPECYEKGTMGMSARRYEMRVERQPVVVLAAVAAVIGVCLSATIAECHCDTMDGPVVAAARLALERGDVTPVLKWVKPEDETVIRDLFAKVLSARIRGAEAKELADRYFFESLVRIHRAGEGAAYTGLQPAGTPIEPAVALADESIAAGDVATLTNAMRLAVDAGIRERFTRVIATKKRADENVTAGREFVQAYVELTHYVERLHRDATGTEGHAEGTTAASSEHKH